MATGEGLKPGDGPMMIGEWRVDPRADEIESGGRVIKLEPLRMRLLVALAERPGEVVLSNELLDTVWKGAIVTPGSLYQSVAQLRQLLGDSVTEPRYIATVPRKGYRLVAPVVPIRTPTPLLLPGAMLSSEAAVAPVLSPATAEVAEPPPRVASAETAVAPTARAPLRRREMLAGGLVATLVVGAGGAVWWSQRPAPGPIRLAVLPFTDGSAAKLDQPLANGLTEDVIRTLGRHPAMEVLAFDAVTRIEQGADMLADAARRLNVAFALTGEMLRAGERVRVTTQLIALPSERVRRSASFDETMASLSELPQAIAVRAIDALDLKPVLPEARAAPSSAYEMYVLGNDAMRARTPEGIERARRYYTLGIEIDALYARNYVGLGWSWIQQHHIVGGLDWPEAYARAEPLFTRALRLDSDLIEAKLGLANVARQHGRYDEARRSFEAVLKSHPNSSVAHFGLALADDYEGWPARALAHYERAAALDPTNFNMPVGSGLQLMYLGKAGEADARFKRSIDLDPLRPNGFYSLGILHWLRGRLDESIYSYREALKRNDKLSYIWADYAFVCIDLGLYGEARRAFMRTAELLGEPNWALVESEFVWVAEGARPPLPSALVDSSKSPAPVESLLIFALTGEPVSAATVRAINTEQAAYRARPTTLYDIVSGRFRTLDVASLFAAARAPDLVAPLLDQVERTLNDYEQRGVMVPAFAFHRARLLALRGDRARALDSLQRAVDQGWSRTWWMRRDPAFESLRGEGAFTAVMQKIDAQLASQRKNVAM